MNTKPGLQKPRRNPATGKIEDLTRATVIGIGTKIIRKGLGLRMKRQVTILISLVSAILVIALMARILPPDAAAIMLDIKRASWPFTVQNVLWLAFFVGLGELSLRWRAGRLEESQFGRDYLPLDDETVLRPGDDITPIYQKVRSSKYRDVCFLPRLIERCVLNFNLGQSVDQTNSLLNSSLELFLHELDLRYNMIRYITWLIPSLGFIRYRHRYHACS